MTARRVRTAGLLSVAAGIVYILGAVLPWARLFGPDRSYSAFQLGLWGPAIAVIVTGIVLIAVGVTQPSWAPAVAMAAVFVTILSQLAVHTDLYQSLTALGQIVGGDIGHVGGFGTTVVFAAGGTALVAAVAGAVSAGPAVGATRIEEPPLLTAPVQVAGTEGAGGDGGA